MTKKRIAVFSVHTCPLAFLEGKETGGMNVYVMAQARELEKLGYEIDIFTRCQSQKDEKVVTLSPNLRVIHLLAGPSKSVNKKEVINYLDQFTQSFLSFVNAGNKSYDLFHAHYYLSGLVCQKLKKQGYENTPLVISFHTLALMKNLVAHDELEKEEKERIDAEMSLVKTANLIIAPSKTDSEYLQYLYNCPKDKIKIVTPGVDTKLFKPMSKEVAKKHINAKENHKIILFVGRIEPLKGIDTILYALKIIKQKNPGIVACLWIVGGDISQPTNLWSLELQKLERLRKILGLETEVHFVGRKVQNELPFYYNASEFVVMPSHYESFGMAALEAMACAIPVITTNVAGVSSLLDNEHQKLITTTNNPLLLAAKMEFLLKNQKEHEKISQEVLEKVQDLSWDKVTEKISALYQNL